MSLIAKLLARNAASMPVKRRVLARVLLDDAGRVLDVRLKQSSGDPALDGEALIALRATRYPQARLGSRTSRRWHDVAWAAD